MATCPAFGLEQGLSVRRVFDLLVAIPAALVGCDRFRTIENPQRTQRGCYSEGLAHECMGYGVIIEIEAHVGRLADFHMGYLVGWEWLLGQRQQLGLLFGEGVADSFGALFGQGPVASNTDHPHFGLLIQIIDISECSACKETIADESDRPLDATLLVSSSD